MYLGRIQSIQADIDENTVVVVCDASLHPNTSCSAGGMVFITKHQYWTNTVNLSNILPTSSCRAELATICSAVIDLPQHNIIVYCDAQAAIDSINHLKNKSKRLERINSIDLLQQIVDIVPQMDVRKIKGHDHKDKHNLNHLADFLSHDHSAADCPLNLLTILPNEMQQPAIEYANGFRIRKLVESLKNHDMFISYFAALRDLDILLSNYEVP